MKENNKFKVGDEVEVFDKSVRWAANKQIGDRFIVGWVNYCGACGEEGAASGVHAVDLKLITPAPLSLWTKIKNFFTNK